MFVVTQMDLLRMDGMIARLLRRSQDTQSLISLQRGTAEDVVSALIRSLLISITVILLLVGALLAPIQAVLDSGDTDTSS